MHRLHAPAARGDSGRLRAPPSLIRALESQGDHIGTIFTRVCYRLGELEADRHARLDALAALEATEAVPFELLDTLPVTTHRPARQRAGARHGRTTPTASWYWRETRRQRRPRWPTSPRYSTVCPHILAGSLDAASQGELRALFDALQLDVVFRPVESTVDVEVTLYDRNGDNGNWARADDWLAPPAGAGPVLRRVILLDRRIQLA